MKAILLVFVSLWAGVVNAQDLYSKTYGSPDHAALIFLHGGPGFNSAGFEVTTAETLAAAGYYVIVYDRRGEGRSTSTDVRYTFDQTFEDLQSLYEKYELKQASLIGHSFGGVVASLFAEKHPEMVKAVVLVGAPVSLQETFKTILRRAKAIYEAKDDRANLGYIAMLEKMDTTSLAYSSYSFGHAMLNGFYTPTDANATAQALYALFGTDPVLKQYGSQSNFQAPQGFWQNERYTTIDLTETLVQLVERGLPMYGLYGKDDGLYSADQVGDLAAIIGEEQLRYWDRCSHNVFIDQQALFIETLQDWLK